MTETVELPDSPRSRYDWMQKVTGIETREDLVCTALGFMEWAIKSARSGKIIVADDQAGERIELISQALVNARKNA